MAIAVTRKINGSSMVCQSGWIWVPKTISIEPSELWCIIGSTMPRPMKMYMTPTSFLRAFSSPNFSRMVGVNSIHSTMM